MGTSRWRYYLPRMTAQQAWRVLSVNWPLGFTSFGGPPVHFKIFHDRFCDRQKWISEQVYQELFSISQALSGPASTKMLYCINLIHSGFPAAALSFLVWSLPGALAMYGLSIGVSHMGENLPREVYALLSGLNAATVGIIALAAVGLSEKAITDNVTRILVLVGAAAGMLYNALWYFPLLMITAACVTIVYDFRWLHGPYRVVAGIFKRKQRPEVGDETIELPPRNTGAGHRGGEEVATAPSTAHSAGDGQAVEGFNAPQQQLPTTEAEPRIVPPEYRLNFSWKLGVATIASFLASFIVVMVLRGVLAHMPLLYNFFANMYLAGTIIFGGGPVVIPLLREYVVAEGWVSARDFLIGLAIIQALPGPNFNFAVFLGSLTAINGGYNSVGGALVGFLGIFFPGLILVHGTMGIWSALRNRRWIKSSVRGVNAAAVGLIYTAVYRLWQIGYIDEGFQSGTSLGDDPWWVVVTVTSYAGGRWFGASPPVAIALGAALGLIRYGVISHSGA